MSDIKSELTRRLDEAKVRYEDARREVELLAGLIAEFERLTAGDTRTFPAVPSAADWSQEDTWKPWIGQRIQVTYADGSTVTGVLEDTSYRRYRLTDVPGYPADEVYVGALVSVTGVVPAELAVPVDSHPTGAHQLPDPAVTLTDPPATAPKDGAQ